MSDPSGGDKRFEAFISYARKDAGDWTRVLAENLERLGVRTFLDAWEIGPGDVLVHELDRGILNSTHGVLVLSPAALESRWVREEQDAMITRAVQGIQRVIPVLYADVEMPAFLASRVWVDFRGADGPEYERQVRNLADEIKGVRPQRPTVGEPLAPPPGTGFKAVGPRRRVLRIGKDRVRLIGGENVIEDKPAGLDPGAEEDLWEMERRRRRFGAPDAAVLVREPGVAEGRRSSLLQPYLLDAGRALARCYLPAAVASALGDVVAEAERSGSSLELGLELEDPELTGHPWETLVLPSHPDRPLVLHPHVEVFRAVPAAGSIPAIQVPPPLRLLVAIGSPESDNARGELLDYEKELSSILDAVEQAEGTKPFVEILHRGIEAIHEALAARPFHVLYVSCHAGPGKLILEKSDGRHDEVSAARLCDEAFPADRRPPLVVLASCSSGQGVVLDGKGGEGTEGGEPEGGARYLPGIAEALLARGVPAAVAMNTAVSDHYATRLGASLFSALTGLESPDPLTVLSVARREVEAARQAEAAVPREPEWATPALYLAVPRMEAAAGTSPPAMPVSLPLYAPEATPEAIPERPEAVFTRGVTVRGVEHFVGRRREERVALQALAGDENAGVLFHGIGGIGKSTLSAQVLRNLAGGWVLASVTGEISPDDLMSAVGEAIVFQVPDVAATRELRGAGQQVRRTDLTWQERLKWLDQKVFPQKDLRLAILLDNFEDNLEPSEDGHLRVKDDHLAGLLGLWLEAPGRSRLVFTSRRTFRLPGDGQDRLLALPLGPLSWAESRKLMLRLPALEALNVEDQRRAYVDVGGHPRALEYLDALLRGGKARFHDVTRRLEKILEKQQGLERPESWTAGPIAGALDLALAEAVTAASADVLLDDLLAQLDDDPLAKRLLLGASVYREPVAETALQWQVSEKVEREPDPEGEALIEEFIERQREAREKGGDLSLEGLGFTGDKGQTLSRAFAQRMRPPLQVPDGFGQARRHLLELGLLGLLAPDQDTIRYVVHRFTAGALHARVDSQVLVEAHQKAIDYWRWKVAVIPQSRSRDVDDLLEARYHSLEAQDLEQLISLTEGACERLRTLGSYQRSVRLCREMLHHLPSDHPRRAVFLHEMGILAESCGSYEEALDWYRKSLSILEELGDRSGMATSYHQLGMVAQLRGSYEEALDWYRKSLSILEDLGDRSGMASSYHQLGNASCLRGSYDEALDWYRKALAIDEELRNRSGMAISYHQLGVVAEKCGSYDEALDWYRKSLAIEEEFGHRSGMADTYHQLGNVSLLRGSYDEALDWYRKSLATREKLGDRLGMAASYHQLGIVAEHRGSYDEALDWYRKSLAISEQLGSQSEMASTTGQIAALLTKTGAREQAVPLSLRSLAIHLQLGTAKVRTNLHWLRRQQELLGEDRFREIVVKEVGDENGKAVFDLLDQFAMMQQADSTEAGPDGLAPPPPPADS